ncbi:MAG: hypothetical protein AAGJ82_05285 [Bacteroidota bacterium]
MRILLLLLPIFLTVGIIATVNTSQGTPSSQRLSDQCSRYCHNAGCRHYTAEHVPPWVKRWYEWHISLFHHNPFGLSYKMANMLVYELIYPLVLLLLWWNLIRPRKPLLRERTTR